jgi:hypothetical protein
VRGVKLTRTGKPLGILIAAALKGAWRPASHIPSLSAEQLSGMVPFILAGGAGALLWWHAGASLPSQSGSTEALKQAYLLHTVQAAVHERKIKQGIEFFRSRNVEPLLGKGCAIASLYPEPGLRPFGDFDFYVSPNEYNDLIKAVKSHEAPDIPLDLHQGCAELNDRGFEELFARSRIISYGGVDVRILGPEDHLRLICLHSLRHGAWRPIWLCDIAVAYESSAHELDWDYLLSGDARRTDWLICALGLARQLLDLSVDAPRIEPRVRNLPYWLVPETLKQWGTPFVPQGRRMPMRHFLKHPKGVISALLERWPNGIEATVDIRGSFNNMPRLPFQLTDCASRVLSFLANPPAH